MVWILIVTAAELKSIPMLPPSVTFTKEYQRLCPITQDWLCYFPSLKKKLEIKKKKQPITGFYFYWKKNNLISLTRYKQLDVNVTNIYKYPSQIRFQMCSHRPHARTAHILYCLSEALSRLCVLAQVIPLLEDIHLHHLEKASPCMFQSHCCESLFFCSQVETVCPHLCTPTSFSTLSA